MPWLRVTGKRQLAGLEIYVTDPAVWEDAWEAALGIEPHPGGGLLLQVHDTDVVCGILVEACNSADADGDMSLCHALQALCTRVRRAQP